MNNETTGLPRPCKWRMDGPGPLWTSLQEALRGSLWRLLAMLASDTPGTSLSLWFSRLAVKESPIGNDFANSLIFGSTNAICTNVSPQVGASGRALTHRAFRFHESGRRYSTLGPECIRKETYVSRKLHCDAPSEQVCRMT